MHTQSVYDSVGIQLTGTAKLHAGVPWWVVIKIVDIHHPMITVWLDVPSLPHPHLGRRIHCLAVFACPLFSLDFVLPGHPGQSLCLNQDRSADTFAVHSVSGPCHVICPL